MSHNNRPEDDTQLLGRGSVRRDGAPGENEPPTILLDRPGLERPSPERPNRVTTGEAMEGGEEMPSRRALTTEVGAGTVLQGRFALVELVGDGGMSRVFKAIDRRRVEARSENPFLAVKVLTVSPDHHLASIQALDREAHKLQSLTHPNRRWCKGPMTRR